MGRKFMKEIRGDKSPTGLAPDFGAIFMSSKSTKNECLQNKLFGLPSAFSSFVKHVKVGMLLFLFEYESRQLYGVYEATSDGAIDIMPHAYRSSGKKFPAQVKIKIVWNCKPLLEHEFFDAIRDNYYQQFKFHFGLSKDQVYHLLRLFHQKRMWTVEPCVFSTQHVYPKEQTDDLYLEDHVPIRCTRTGLNISKVCTHCNHDDLFTGKEDPIIDSQLISSPGTPVTKKIDSISYYHPYDPEKHYFQQFPTYAETGIKPPMSGPGSGFPILFGGQFDELHIVTKDLELGDFIPLESSPCTARISNPDCRQAAFPSSRHYGYPEPFHDCRFSPLRIREKVASASQNDEEFTYEDNDRGPITGTRSKRLGALEQSDDLYLEDHERTGCTKDLELGDFVPMDFSLCAKPYTPTTIISTPNHSQATALSSRHSVYPEPRPHRVREKVAPYSQNDEDQEFICEANDRGGKACARSKRLSVFSRINVAPKDCKESDSNNGSPDESTLAIMEQLQRKHDNWSKEFNRTNFNGHEEASSPGRRKSVFSRLRLTSNPIERDATGIMKAGPTVENPKTNSRQKAKRKFFDKSDLEVGKRIDGIEIFESNSTLAQKVEIRHIDPEGGSTTQKQSKRRKLVRPVFGHRPLSTECITHPTPDQLPCEGDQVSKEEAESLVVPAESVCVGDDGLSEPLSLVDEGQVSSNSFEEGSDEATAKEAVHEVPVEAGVSGSLLSREPENELVKVV